MLKYGRFPTLSKKDSFSRQIPNHQIMKLLLNLVLCFSLIFVVSCNKEDDTLKKSEDFELDFNETATFEEGNFSIKFVELIEDSRCPEFADCLWGGRATVRLEITENEVLSSITLVTENSIDLDSFLVAEYANYKIELIDISPYPDVNTISEDSDYTVTFKIDDL